MSSNGSSPVLDLDRAGLEETLKPLERASMLPPRSFTASSVLGWELEHLFRGGWICVGHASALAEPGAYLMRVIGDESVFVIAGKDGEARGFFNVCRHRGARIFEEPEGKVRGRIRCPYHAWSYDFDGSLLGTRAHRGPRGLRSRLLRPPPGGGRGGGRLVMVNLSESPTPAAEYVGELAPWLERYALGRLEPGGRRDYEVAANWKAIAENYNECLHCPGVHPELNALSDYSSGDPGRRRRRLVRGLDDAERRGRDDGPRRRTRRGSPADRRPARRRAPPRLLLRAVPEHAGLPASRLRDAAHPLAARAGPDRRDLRMVLRAGHDRGARTSIPPTPSTSGTR